jgi:hypothetical protein
MPFISRDNAVFPFDDLDICRSRRALMTTFLELALQAPIHPPHPDADNASHDQNDAAERHECYEAQHERCADRERSDDDNKGISKRVPRRKLAVSVVLIQKTFLR